MPLWLPRGPPKVKRGIFGRFSPIPPQLQKAAISSKMVRSYQIFFLMKAENKNFHFLQNLHAQPYFRPSYTSLNIFIKKSPKNGHFGKYAPSLTKCHFFVFDFFVLKLERQLKINVNFHSVKKKIAKRTIFDEVLDFLSLKRVIEGGGFGSGLIYMKRVILLC